ncbi:MAG: DegV family protein [Vulcanimicrobiaceae bacterium]
MPVAIVTDSTSDIEPDRARALGVSVVPLLVVFGERSYRDYVDLTRADFYALLATEKTLPITSAPTAAMFEEAFEQALGRGDEVLCIVVSSRLSGTINAAQAAAGRFAQAPITILDSSTVAGGLGLLVTVAQESARAGMSVEAIVRSLERPLATQRLFACLPDLSHLQRTGRIGRARGLVGTLMRIVPVLCLEDGEIAPEATVRTFARAQERMLELCLEANQGGVGTRYVVMHTNAPALARRIAERLDARLEMPTPIEVREAGPAIAVHAGAGALGIFSLQQGGDHDDRSSDR